MSTWIPRSGREEIGGCIWLPRMISKARRIIDSEATGKRAGEYMYGKHDAADAQVLKFLGISDEEVLDIVRAIPDDEAAAMHVLTTSSKTPADCAAFTRRFRLLIGPFLAMMDADEGRRKPDLLTAILRWVYNDLVMPPAYAYFKIKDR